jgi:hypothetical protein
MLDLEFARLLLNNLHLRVRLLCKRNSYHERKLHL